MHLLNGEFKTFLLLYNSQIRTLCCCVGRVVSYWAGRGGVSAHVASKRLVNFFSTASARLGKAHGLVRSDGPIRLRACERRARSHRMDISGLAAAVYGIRLIRWCFQSRDTCARMACFCFPYLGQDVISLVKSVGRPWQKSST
jgi:hypothetical protein